MRNSRALLPAVAGASLMVATALVGWRRAPNDGNIGEIRYSILDPTHFQAENGSGWVLMDGRAITDTDLCRDRGICSVPDARGVFLRGMNLGRDAATGDPDGNRAAGAAQADQVARHDHGLNHQVWVALQWGGHGSGPNGGDHPLFSKGRGAGDNNPQWLATTAVGGSETRPRNIAAYAYMKVNR
jgi:hypothetical protein